MPKLVRSYALDALEVNGNDSAPDAEAIRSFIGEVSRANKDVREAVGMGVDVRLSAPRLVGGALVHDDAIVHLSAFRLDAPESPESPPPGTRGRGFLSSLRWRRDRRSEH